MKVLFLCHGNINRSAAGEIILKSMFPSVEVRSAGLKDKAGGQITNKRMREALNSAGYSTEGIRSRKASQDDIDWSDIVLYMDDSNEKKIVEQFGENTLMKSRRLGMYIGVSKIPDPQFSGPEAFKQVVAMIETSIKKFAGVYGLQA